MAPTVDYQLLVVIKKESMKLVISYLLVWLIGVMSLWTIDVRGLTPEWLVPYSLGYKCALMGALGGVVYCLRAVYLNRSVKAKWNEDWHVWYYLRPVVSLVVGMVSCVFLNAGLLVLDASQVDAARASGFLGLSFIAGLNVDRFLVRLEDIAQSTWGIRPSRASEDSSKQGKEDK